MPDDIHPTTPDVTPGSSSSDGTGSSDSTAETAKSEAQDVASTAVESGAEVASTAKAEAGEVVSQAVDGARELFDQVRSELTDQASSQQSRVAHGLHDLADELERMSEGSTQSGLASSLTQQVSTRARTAASWMEDREPGDMVHEAQQLAGRRPGAFLAAAAAIGFVGARLVRGLSSDSASPTSSSPTSSSPTSPSPTSSGPASSDATPDASDALAPSGVLGQAPTVTTSSHGLPVTHTSSPGVTSAPGVPTGSTA